MQILLFILFALSLFLHVTLYNALLSQKLNRNAALPLLIISGPFVTFLGTAAFANDLFYSFWTRVMIGVFVGIGSFVGAIRARQLLESKRSNKESPLL